jgi:hypothetical protein
MPTSPIRFHHPLDFCVLNGKPISMQVKPSTYDYLAPPEKPYQVLLKRAESVRIVDWHQHVNHDGATAWVMRKSTEFEEWLEGLRGDFLFRWIWVS